MVRWPSGVIAAVRFSLLSVAGLHNGSGSTVYWPGAGSVGWLSGGGHETLGGEEWIGSVRAHGWSGKGSGLAVARMRSA